MEKLKSENSGKEKKVKKETVEEILSPCLKAPSAEHARAHDIDDPCDDNRG